jgi:hypothetical protein
MEMYSSEDADFLIDFYKDKVIGKPLENIGDSIIISLEKKAKGDDLFRVTAYGTPAKNLIPRRDISIIASNLHLPSPTEVLASQGQGT